MSSDKKISELLQVTRGNIDNASLIPLVEPGAIETSYATREDLLGTADTIFDVRDYGAVGNGVADDGAEIQLAIDAVIANGGGTLLFPPGTYKFATGLSFDPITLTSQVDVRMYGAVLDYTGTADAVTIESNVTAVDDQDAQKSFHFFGLHVKGTSSADSALRLKATNCTFKNTVFENFTTTTSQQASLVLDAYFLEWVEENVFDGLEIKNAGNGICFISREDSGGAAASLGNNYFRNVNIWLTQASGKGVYGVGLGASTTANIARVTFEGIIVHPVTINNCIAYDFQNCYVEGVVLTSPSVDAYGTCNSLTAFRYNNAEAIVLISPTAFPLAEVDTYFSGSGLFNVIAGNYGGQTFLSRYTDMLDEDAMTSNSDTKVPTQQSVKAYADTKQPSDSDLTAIAALSPSNDDIIQRKAGAWTNRTIAQLKTDLNITTKEQWILPDSASAAVSAYGDYGVFGIGTTGEVFFRWAVPFDFTSFTSVELVGIPDATETIQFDVDTDYGSVGEGHTTHSGQIVDQTKSVTANTIWSHDIKSTLSSAVAGDIIGCRVGSDTDFLYILGLRIKYT